MKRVITFGEIMMRLNPAGYLRLSQAERERLKQLSTETRERG